MGMDAQSTKGFTITEGGVLHWLFVKMNLGNQRWKLVVIMLCLTWLPLVVLTAWDGTLYSGNALPFLKDVAIQCRLLLAVPILVLIKDAVYFRIPEVLMYLSEMLKTEEERKELIEYKIPRAKKRSDSFFTDFILLLLVIGISFSPLRGTAMLFQDHVAKGSWLAVSNAGSLALTNAGYFSLYFSIPIFQFLFLRWLWRYLVWATLLFQISRMNLSLPSTHPDGAGGLGITIFAHRNFVLFFSVGGIVLAGEMLARLQTNPALFDVIRTEMVVYIVGCVLILLLPLFFFTRQLMNAKRRGLMVLSKVGTNLSERFENGWLSAILKEEKVADVNVDSSIFYDYASIYGNMLKVRIVLVTFIDIILLAAILFLPFIPVFFVHFSVGELMQKIISLLL